MTDKYRKREAELLALIGICFATIVKKYPNCRPLIDNLHADIINLIVDWD